MVVAATLLIIEKVKDILRSEQFKQYQQFEV